MAEESKKLKISGAKLDWRKSDDFTDKYSEVMNLSHSNRSISLEFGSLDHDGRKDNQLVDPHINFHTRITVTKGHLEAISKVLNNFLSQMENEDIEKE